MIWSHFLICQKSQLHQSACLKFSCFKLAQTCCISITGVKLHHLERREGWKSQDGQPLLSCCMRVSWKRRRWRRYFFFSSFCDQLFVRVRRFRDFVNEAMGCGGGGGWNLDWVQILNTHWLESILSFAAWKYWRLLCFLNLFVTQQQQQQQLALKLEVSKWTDDPVENSPNGPCMYVVRASVITAGAAKQVECNFELTYRQTAWLTDTWRTIRWAFYIHTSYAWTVDRFFSPIFLLHVCGIEMMLGKKRHDTQVKLKSPSGYGTLTLPPPPPSTSGFGDRI